MKNQLIGFAIVCAVFLLPAENMDLVTFSDLRLRNEVNESATLFGSWKLKDGVAGESLIVDSKRISGSDGCNRFSASLMIADDKLQMGPIMSTRAICNDLNGSDEKYRITLARVTAYRLVGTSGMELLDSSGKVLLTFTR